ncbi:hypothetical protein Tco_0057135, partial [Tanacetum coccineum]
ALVQTPVETRVQTPIQTPTTEDNHDTHAIPAPLEESSQ